MNCLGTFVASAALTAMALTVHLAAAGSDYFQIRIVDEQTGRGVPLVELRTTSNISCWSDSNGIVAWNKPGLMDSDVYFAIQSPGHKFPGILRQRPKLDGVVEGVTTRHELEQILPGFSTYASDSELFWARWQEPSDPFACGAGPIDANRDWKNVNVLAISEASGVLKRYRVCSDRDLGDCLTSMADNVVSPPDADSTALEFSVHWDRGPYRGAREFIGKAAFDAAGITPLQTRRGSVFRTLDPPVRFVIPLKQIQQIAIRHDADPEHVNMELRFKPGTQPVDNLTSYGASPRDTWRLIWLVRSLNPSFAPVRAASGGPAVPRESVFAPAR